MGKDDAETVALKQELDDLINKCKVRNKDERRKRKEF